MIYLFVNNDIGYFVVIYLAIDIDDVVDAIDDRIGGNRVTCKKHRDCGRGQVCVRDRDCDNDRLDRGERCNKYCTRTDD